MSDEGTNGNGLATKPTQEIQRTPTPDVPIEGGVMKPTGFNALWRIACAIDKSGIKPAGCKDPESVFIALAAGLEVGLSPMQSIQNVMVVNNRPALFGDAPLGLVMASGLIADFAEKFEGEGDNLTAVCRSKRKGFESHSESRFSVADAKKAGLWGKSGPWSQYPKRMLQFRARGFNLRDTFPDVLKGFVDDTEASDTPVRPAFDPGAMAVAPATSGAETLARLRTDRVARALDGTETTVQEAQAHIEAIREEQGIETPAEVEPAPGKGSGIGSADAEPPEGMLLGADPKPAKRRNAHREMYRT